MEKEKFLYDYLVKYNSSELIMKEELETENASDGWRLYDEKHLTSGLIFYSLRNLLVHDTVNTISEIDSSGLNYEVILEDQDILELDNTTRIKYIDFLIRTSNIERKLEDKQYSLFVSISKNNSFRSFTKKSGSGLRSNIFMHHTAKFISFDISTYNHNVQKGEYEFYKDTRIYIETEFYANKIGCHLFLHNKELIPPKVDIVFEFSGSNPTGFLNEQNWIAISYLAEGKQESYSNKQGSVDYINQDLLNEKIENVFKTQIVDSICSEVKSLYNEARMTARIIGLYY